MNVGLRDLLPGIYEAALGAVEPGSAVKRFLRRRGSLLEAADQSYDLGAFRRVFLVGAGKAGVPMSRAVEDILGDRLAGGMVVVKRGFGTARPVRTEVLEAGHPEPDQDGFEAARRLIDFLEEKLQADDLLMVVLSGGGSALLPAPVEGVSLDDKQATTGLLLRSGADIHEINAIRKHLSRLKGGRLLDYTRGCRVLTLILSDVVGDDLTSIASGPTAPDPTTFQDCLETLDRYRLLDRVPAAVRRYLQAAQTGKETAKPGDPRFDRVHNLIVGSNILALQSAASQARSLGLQPLILSSSLRGDCAELARFYVALAREVFKTSNPVGSPACLIGGGETTVKVRGEGKGGRCQEFALHCATQIADWGESPVLFAALGTDGNDGPTDAAGAIAAPDTVLRAAKQGLSARDQLERNDSYHYFKALDDLIITGPTQTNVMDIYLALIGR